MSELSNISTAANRAIVERQLHHAERPGAGQIVAFNADVDAVVVKYSRALDNLNAREGTNVTSAKAALVTLGNAAKAAAAGGVEVPAAA